MNERLRELAEKARDACDAWKVNPTDPRLHRDAFHEALVPVPLPESET